MKRRFLVRTAKEIKYPIFLAGALESMGFLVDCSFNGTTAGNGSTGNGFDLRIEDSQGHTFQGFNLEKWFASRKPSG